MKKLNYILLASFGVVTLFSCKTNLEENPISKGNANFSRYVAIGNSLTAGYSDGALNKEGQQNAYPNLLSQQFAMVGGGSFKTPFMNAGGGNDGSGNPRRVMGYVIPCGSTSPTISPVLDPKGATPLNNIASAGPYNLVGVPGARAIDANFNLYSALNPFLQRFCQTPGGSTMLTEALRINPTFFTVWLGNNDVLAYATSGALTPTSAFSPSISDPVAVEAALTQLVDTLTSFGAKGAIANIPDITSIPFFTTVPWNAAVLNQGKADTLNAVYSGLGLNHITWTAGANGLVIIDSTAPGNMRHATASDYILLTTPGDSLRCGQWGTNPAKPLKDQYVLDESESLTIAAAINQYNVAISGIASKFDIALVDMRSYMKSVKSGIVYNGVKMDAAFVSGGAFSLDGVHPTARGYALVANEFLKSINAKYKSSVPLINALKYNGVILP